MWVLGIELRLKQPMPLLTKASYSSYLLLHNGITYYLLFYSRRLWNCGQPLFAQSRFYSHFSNFWNSFLNWKQSPHPLPSVCLCVWVKNKVQLLRVRSLFPCEFQELNSQTMWPGSKPVCPLMHFSGFCFIILSLNCPLVSFNHGVFYF